MPIVIASRTIDLAGPSGSAVQVSIMQPEPDGNDYRCEFEIVGLGEKTIKSYGMGVDSAQALILTLQQIGTRLYTSNEGKAGLLSWLGMKNLGFPVPDNIADLVPNDPRPSGMLFDFRYAPDHWHRTIDCEDWPSAREIAIGVASDRKVEWVEIHTHAGASELLRHPGDSFPTVRIEASVRRSVQNTERLGRSKRVTLASAGRDRPNVAESRPPRERRLRTDRNTAFSPRRRTEQQTFPTAPTLNGKVFIDGSVI